MHILSIQSSVAYGHVGNAAAVFPLQRLGAEVSAINTVEFSNHPGYGEHTGQVVAPEAVQALLEGVAARNVLWRCDALLSGYIGASGTGEVLLEAHARLKSANPRALWCCDPVIGDEGPGVYVRPGIAEFFRDRAVGQADLLTPNHFELNCLAEVRAAVTALQARMPEGPRVVMVTSLHVEDTPADSIDCLVGADGGFDRLRVPRLPISASGAGDAMAALFLFHMLAGQTGRGAMEKAASSIHGVLSRTCAAGERELLLVAAQDEFLNPSNSFASQPC